MRSLRNFVLVSNSIEQFLLLRKLFENKIYTYYMYLLMEIENEKHF